MLTLSDLQSHLPEINRFAPKPVSLILVVLIAYSLSQLAWQLAVPLPRIEKSAVSGVTESLSRPQARPDFGMEIARYHLFGLPPVITANQVVPADQAVERETTLPLKLLGIYASQIDAESLAIIDTGNDEKVFGIGDSITGGATLRRVARDRVILERNGVLEALLLPKEDSLDIGKNPAPPTASVWQTTNNLPQAVTAGNFRELRVEILNSPRKLKELARFQPFQADGQMRGFQIFPKSKKELFQQLGIESGDVVTSVNGIALDQPEKGVQALRELAKATQVTLTLERGGSEIVVQHNIE